VRTCFSVVSVPHYSKSRVKVHDCNESIVRDSQNFTPKDLVLHMQRSQSATCWGQVEADTCQKSN
jgi:hypothetical protein